MSGHGQDIHKEIRGYWLVFASLIVLTAVTVLISRYHLPPGLAIPLALTVATIKASLVVCFFMHFISERQLIYGIYIFVIIFFAGMLGLTLHNHLDVITGTEDTGRRVALELLKDKPHSETETHVP